ncbi:hypothetical protein [Nocardia paucivorans]|uniref:hypothetical protein n=1 Tax=Nocardia paucivorans TaxID=114259 RepID=UPI0012F7F635|nr:hypothetical protein [Nocardia paucivorans]
MAPLKPKDDDNTTGIMKPGSEIKEGNWLWSPNKEYRMGVQNGHMVIVHNNTGMVVHESKNDTDGAAADRIKFTDRSREGSQNLELRDDKTALKHWSAKPDLEHAGPAGREEGPGGKDQAVNWQFKRDGSPQRFVLTNDGNLVAVKYLPTDWDGNLDGTKYEQALWYWKKPSEISAAKLKAQKEEYIRGDRPGKSPTEGSKISDYPLEIEAPPGASDDLKLGISVANLQLRYLMSQMGSGDYVLPKFLTTDEKKDQKEYEGTVWSGFMDDNLSGDFMKDIGQNRTSEEYKKAVRTLEKQEIRWDFSDEQLAGLTEKLGRTNHRVYKRMYDRIENLREEIWKSTEEGVQGYYGGSSFTTNFTQGGIQDPAEETAIFKLIRNAVSYCIDQVNNYAEAARESGRELKDSDPHGPGYEKPAKEEPKKKTTTEEPTKKETAKEPTQKKTTQSTPPVTTQTPPVTTQTPPVTTQTPPVTTAQYVDPNTGTQQQQPTTQNVDFSPTYEDLLDTDTNGTSTETADTSDNKSAGVTPVSQVTPSPTRTDSGTTPTGQPVTPTANTGGGMMDPNAMAMAPAMLGMANQAANQNQTEPGRNDGGDKRREQPGPVGTTPGPNQPTTTPPGPNTGGPTTVVTATNAGTPPPVQMPGQMVDHPLPDKSTVQVSSTVAEALNKVQTNTALDAVNAYHGTVGESTPAHPWMTVASATEPIDGGRLSTGDVVQWDDGQNRHSALLVKKDGGLFFLDNGQLVPFDTESPNSDKYGKFAGVFHPSGIDAGSSSATAPAELPPPLSSTTQV